MAVTTNTQFSIDGVSFVANLFHKLVGNIDTRIAEMQTIRALSQLSDRDLEDIGITRANITNIAKHAVQK